MSQHLREMWRGAQLQASAKDLLGLEFAASTSGIQSESPTPLDYRGKFWGPSTRYYLTDPGAPEIPKNDNYFTDRPKTGFVPPTDPDTVAWIDVFEDNGPGRQWIYIAFMAVRTDYRGQGLGSRLIAHLYATYPNARIEWGTLIGDRTPVLYKRYKQTHPAQTGGGSAW
jgi:GNAT superfamily N-acetyltransferase